MADGETVINEKSTPSANIGEDEKIIPSTGSKAQTVEVSEASDAEQSETVQKAATNDEHLEENPIDEAATLSIEEITRQLAEETQKAENHWDNLLRKQAEYDNLQKRMTREVENVRKFGLEKIATELLTVKDSMELGIDAATKPETNLDSIHEGMTLTLKMLSDVMAKFGIQEINPIEEKFNPQWHEAMAMQPMPSVEDGTVLLVHQKGYLLNERLLRPARVVVAKAVQTEKPIENQG
ncbi:GrpE protein [Beggiatoa sp. PS]|nr:GrpE protein [Beggiatoa sp. PS]